MIRVFIAVAILLIVAIIVWCAQRGNGNRVSIPIQNGSTVLSDADAIRYSKIVLKECGLWADGMSVDPLAYGDIGSNRLVGRNLKDQSRCIVPWVHFDATGKKVAINVYLKLDDHRIDGKVVQSK